jgi:hypothetical protein
VLALGARHLLDSPNHASFHSTKLKAGEKYSQTTIYEFLPCDLMNGAGPDGGRRATDLFLLDTKKRQAPRRKIE